MPVEHPIMCSFCNYLSFVCSFGRHCGHIIPPPPGSVSIYDSLSASPRFDGLSSSTLAYIQRPFAWIPVGWRGCLMPC